MERNAERNRQGNTGRNTEKKEKFYITTAIPYMNTKLHLGFFYETILADVMARFNRLLGKDVFFLTGADEHGQKIYKSAVEKNMSPKDYVDEMVCDMKRLLELYTISNDYYIRTTDEKHQKVVQNILIKLKESGDIYKGVYEGWYCVPCETFLLDSQLMEGKCPECGREAEKVKEENYFFKLSRYENKIREHIEKNPDFVIPETRKNEVLGILNQGLKDISISRTTVKWAVPIPFDSEHFCYVWVDALINYISALGYSLEDDSLFVRYWPCDQHHIGKDILKFHAIIWPAILMALGVELPKHIVVHGWVMLGEEKLSKSKGITLDPDELAQRYGVDAVRYFVTREISFGQDGSFTHEAMVRRYNSDLSNDFGNLVSRTLAMIGKYREGIIPLAKSLNSFETSIDKNSSRMGFAKSFKGANEKGHTQDMDCDAGNKTAGNGDSVVVETNMLKNKWEETKNSAIKYLKEFKYSEYLVEVWEFINLANKYIEDSQPWSLAKSSLPIDAQKLDIILYNLAESIRLATIMLIPFMPSTCRKIFTQLGIGKEIDEVRIEEDGVWGNFSGGTTIGRREILFPRIEEEKKR
ncbi:MAG: methionine--tRNA ligase [Actinobacteria bacterium]|nr:methionine--tRNA ligase [Actinomycetota bacterium]